MVLGGVQAFNLVSILLLVLPGLMGTKLYLRLVNRQDRFGRIDTVAISLAGSLGGLLVMYLWYWIFLSFENCVSGEPFPAAAPMWVDLKPRVSALSEKIFHYITLIAVVVFVGYILGSEGWLIKRLPDPPNKPWRTLLEGVQGGEEDNQVCIETANGDQVVGELDEWSVESQSLVLKNAKGFYPDESDRELPGSRIYLDKNEIARLSVVTPQGGDGPGADGEDTEVNDQTENFLSRLDDEDNSDE